MQGHISRIHNTFLKFSNKKIENPSKNGQDIFTNEDIQMENMLIKRSKSLVIRKLKFKTKTKEYYHPLK